MSTHLDPSTLASSKAVTRPSPEAIAAVTQAPVQGTCSCEQDTTEPPRTYPAMARLLLSSAVSSLAAKRGAFLCREASIT